MRLLSAVAVATAFIATSVAAQTLATEAEIKGAFTGKQIAWGTDGIADYKSNGNYEYYSTSSGQTSRGKYTITDGQICVDFSTRKRCDKIMKDGNGFYMVNSQGTQYRAKIR
jgi:hypothetical protein